MTDAVGSRLWVAVGRMVEPELQPAAGGLAPGGAGLGFYPSTGFGLSLQLLCKVAAFNMRRTSEWHLT